MHGLPMKRSTYALCIALFSLLIASCGGDETTEPGPSDTGALDTGGGSGDDAGAEEDAGAAEDAGATTDTGNGEDTGATTDTGNGEDTGGTPDASEDASADTGEDTSTVGPDILVGLVPGEETNLDNGVEAPSEVDELRCSGSDVAVGLATFEDAERGTSRFGLTCSSIEVNRTADGPRVRFGTRYLVRPADLEGATPTQRADCVGGAVLTDLQTTVNEGLIRGVTGDCWLVSLADDESGLRRDEIRNLPQLQFVDEIIGTPDIQSMRCPNPGAVRAVRVDGPGASAGSFATTCQVYDPLVEASCLPACETGRTCVDGACLCGPGLSDCDDGCVDPLGDEMNCGGCGMACGEGQLCVDGACSEGACEPGGIAPNGEGGFRCQGGTNNGEECTVFEPDVASWCTSQCPGAFICGSPPDPERPWAGPCACENGDPCALPSCRQECPGDYAGRGIPACNADAELLCDPEGPSLPADSCQALCRCEG